MYEIPTESKVHEIAYEHVGSGPPILLIHGLTYDRRMWSPLVSRLAAEHPAPFEATGTGTDGPTKGAIFQLVGWVFPEKPILDGAARVLTVKGSVSAVRGPDTKPEIELGGMPAGITVGAFVIERRTSAEPRRPFARLGTQDSDRDARACATSFIERIRTQARRHAESSVLRLSRDRLQNRKEQREQPQ